MEHDRGAIGADRKGCRRDARIGLAFVVRGLRGGHILGLHLEVLIWVRATGVEHLASDGRITEGRARPEVRREETDRPLEVRGVQEERPAVVARRDVFACSLRLRLGERHRQVTIAEELAIDALLQVESIEREEQPRCQLSHAVEPARIFPGAASVARSVGDVVEIHADATHDELRRRGREVRVTPPAEAAFDVVIKILGFRILRILRMHPGAEKAGLEAVSRVLIQQRPSGGVDREAGVVGLRHALSRDEEVTSHLDLLRGSRKRRCH